MKTTSFTLPAAREMEHALIDIEGMIDVLLLMVEGDMDAQETSALGAVARTMNERLRVVKAQQTKLFAAFNGGESVKLSV